MSGGSLNYAYSRVEEAHHELVMRAETPLHRAFAAHLLKVAKALHDIEWVLSSDYSPGQEVDAINACLSEGAVLEVLIEQSHATLKELREELEHACKGRPSRHYIHGKE